MKIYNEEFVQKVFEVIDEDYIAVNSRGFLFSFYSKPKVFNGKCWDIHGNEITGNIDINGIDWKDSLRVRKWVPKEGERFFVPDVTKDCFYMSFIYEDSKLFDVYVNTLIERELIFKTPEEAIFCAKKMLEAVKKG